MKMFAAIIAAMGMLTTYLSPARACIVREAKMEEAVEYARGLVIARVESVREIAGPGRFFDKTIQVKVLVEKIIGGAGKIGKLELSYSRPHAHQRGDKTVCPLILGSGLEYKLKPPERYLMLLDKKRLVRAEPLEHQVSLAKAFKERDGKILSDVQRQQDNTKPKLVSRATVVMRVKLIKAQGGSKYHWDLVEPIEVFKNVSGQSFDKQFAVAHYGHEKGIPEGVSTIYLEPYGNPKAKHWKLLEGKAESGVSHSEINSNK
ncbi:MAG: hypothetical protein JRJ19_11795 [Deltaproteobacteria bacterium]|nr:hypothetical protein [Deltaproteobacteria bacterium]MBW1872742.1 hypothetical protein [Deltaproteobacteria bacterium]